ncbi:hypothetical protein PI125_g1529 [Phytophthora idaei]|nr:hypothetical protein PI125_g1529 [Phytophthora idaei]
MFTTLQASCNNTANMTPFSASLTMADLSGSSRGYALAVRLPGGIAVDVMYALPSL